MEGAERSVVISIYNGHVLEDRMPLPLLCAEGASYQERSRPSASQHRMP
jgi:hypothetical protein